MADRSMRPLRVLAVYCGDGNPVIVQEFTPGAGWRRTNFRKRASVAWLRKLRAAGVTVVGVEPAPGRCADFTVAELLAGGKV